MLRVFITLSFVFVINLLPAQKHDHIWYLGYDAQNEPTDTLWGRNIIDFNTDDGNPNVYYNGYSYIDLDHTNVTMSDKEGQFIFVYNGTYIENSDFEPMLNGEMINETGGLFGDIIPQSALALPPFENSSEYIMLHESWCGVDGFGVSGCDLYFSVIDMEQNNNLGVVSEKNEVLLIQDTLDAGKLVATHHANGRDWWILNPKDNSDEYYTYLINPDGIHLDRKQIVGQFTYGGLGQASFSPDGQFYVKAVSVSTSEGKFLYLYDFDRCTGQLSNQRVMTFSAVEGAGSGVAFSPNSRLLYHFARNKIYQYDLYSDDINGSELIVAEADGYLDSIPPNFVFVPNFFMGQLAPDGRIYIKSSNSSTVLHTIEKPNVRGVGCMVKQHSVQLPSINLTLPTYPNYRLGPLDGSSCDTLGIDNMPQAYYRYDQDTLSNLKIEFTDLSYYEPATWSWDFGDGVVTQEVSPTHTFSEKGIYEVCLTVTNENGEHTFCRTLYLGTTSTENLANEISNIKVYPNPANDRIYIELEDDFLARMNIYTSTGQFIDSYNLLGDKAMINISKLVSGIYFFEVETQSGQRLWKKVMVQ